MNQWDERFNREEYVYGTAPNEFIQSKLTDDPCHVLAIAEGEGRNAIYAAEQGHHVTAWDYSSVGLDKLQKLAVSRQVKVKTEVVDLTEPVQWPENQWDVVLNVFGHIGDAAVRQRMLNGIKRTLKPGGTYLMEVYSNRQIPYQSGGPKDIQHLYRAQEVLDAFEDWKIVHFYYGEAVRQEGKWHTGLAHVIQIAAQKPV
jgi:SAM-dependent methyltransferase